MSLLSENIKHQKKEMRVDQVWRQSRTGDHSFLVPFSPGQLISLSNEDTYFSKIVV